MKPAPGTSPLTTEVLALWPFNDAAVVGWAGVSFSWAQTLHHVFARLIRDNPLVCERSLPNISVTAVSIIYLRTAIWHYEMHTYQAQNYSVCDAPSLTSNRPFSLLSSNLRELDCPVGNLCSSQVKTVKMPLYLVSALHPFYCVGPISPLFEDRRSA